MSVNKDPRALFQECVQMICNFRHSNTSSPFGKYRPVATLIKGAHSITDVVVERRHTFTHFGEEPGRG